MILEDLLGKTLDEALADMRAAGLDPQVAVSAAPRTQRSEATLRVVRVQPDLITACAFLDAPPKE